MQPLKGLTVVTLEHAIAAVDAQIRAAPRHPGAASP